MLEEKYITLAIHTSDQAMALRRVLESHGLDVRMQKVVIGDMPIAAAVRVRIKEKDLPLALKITESMEHHSLTTSDNVLSGQNGSVLIPIDFKDYTLQACKTGFDLAARLSLKPVLLHAYTTPFFNSSFSVDDSVNYGSDMALSEEITEMKVGKDIKKQSSRDFRELKLIIEKEQEKGTIPSLKFKTILEPGVAEDVIRDYCRINNPSLVVMVTRAKKRKGEEQIGSVTAEVLDTCRVPVFSVPENGNFSNIEKVKKVVFFCNLDQHDLISVDTFMRMFDYPEVDVILIPIVDRWEKNIQKKVNNLKDYFNQTYPAGHFTSVIFPPQSFMLDFNNYEVQAGVEMLIVPNKRRNAILRLLNPGIAHKLLFERDLPLLALPV